MPNERYIQALAALKKAEQEMAAIRNSTLSAKEDKLRAQANFDNSRQQIAALENLLNSYKSKLRQTEEAKTKSIDKHNADLANLENLFDAPMFDLADSFKFTERKTIIPSIDELDKMPKTDDKYKTAFGYILDILKHNAETANEELKAEALALAEYFETRTLTEPDNHSKQNANHIIREKIRNVISNYNSNHKQKADKLPASFKGFKELAASDIDKYNFCMTELAKEVSTNSEYSQYVANYDRYIRSILNLRSVGNESLIKDKLNLAISEENEFRTHYNNIIDGKVPILGNIQKFNGRTYTLYADSINSMISAYNFRIESENAIAAQSPTSSIGNTSKPPEKPLTIKTLDEYNNKLEWLKTERNNLQLNVHNGLSHNYRVIIRNLIAEYNKTAEEKLPETFTALGKSKPEHYNKFAEKISLLIQNSSSLADKDRVADYFNKFDAVKKTEAELNRTADTINEIIKNENKFKAARSKEVDAQTQAIKSVLSPEKYNAMLVNISNQIHEEFDNELTKSDKELESANKKVKLYSVASTILNGVADKVKDLTVTLCLAQIKGELQSQQDIIDKLQKEIDLAEEAVNAVNTLNADKQIEIGKTISSADTQNQFTSGAAAFGNMETNLGILENAQRTHIANTAEEQLQAKKQELAAKKEEYARLLAQKKEEIKTELVSFFNEYTPDDLGDIEAVNTGEPAVLNASAKLEFEILRDIENTVNATNDSLLTKAQQQANANYDMNLNAGQEAKQKSETAETSTRINLLDSSSSKISKLFSENNLTKIDMVASLIEKGLNLYKSIEGNSNDADFNVREKLDGITQSLNDLNNPKKQEHVASKIISASKALCELIETTDSEFKNKYEEAKSEAALKKVINDNLKRLKASYMAIDSTTANAKTTPTFLYTKAKYILNADMATISTCTDKIELVKGYIAETENRKTAAETELVTAEAKLTETINTLREKTSARQELEAAKTVEIEELKAALHKEKSAVVLEGETTANIPFEITTDDLADKKLDGIGMLSKLSGIELGPDATPEELRMALDKIYINGIRASEFLQLDNILQSIANDPTAIRDTYREIGDTFRSFFDKTLSSASDISKQGTQKGDILKNQIIMVENDNFLLRPVVLKRPELENAPLPPVRPKEPVLPKEPERPQKLTGFFAKSKNRELEEKYTKLQAQVNEIKAQHDSIMAEYNQRCQMFNQYEFREALNFNKLCSEMCRDFNKARIEAAKAEYDLQKINAMNQKDKAQNVRRITLDEAIMQSRGEDKSPLHKAQSAQSAHKHHISENSKTQQTPSLDGPAKK